MKRTVAKRLVFAGIGLVALCVLGVASAPAAGPPAARDAFRLADGSAWCRYVAARQLVACRSRDAGPALALARAGEPRTVARTTVKWDARARVLRSGSAWSRNGIRCRAAATSVTCTNPAGAAITLGREGIAALATPLTGP